VRKVIITLASGLLLLSFVAIQAGLTPEDVENQAKADEQAQDSGNTQNSAAAVDAKKPAQDLTTVAGAVAYEQEFFDYVGYTSWRVVGSSPSWPGG
jgi:hypothetical protein